MEEVPYSTFAPGEIAQFPVWPVASIMNDCDTKLTHTVYQSWTVDIYRQRLEKMSFITRV